MIVNELRLGNWIESYMVLHNGMGVISHEKIRDVQVDKTLLKFLLDAEMPTYRPIPLSPTLLQMAGFQKQSGYNDTYIIRDPKFPNDDYAAVGNFSVFYESGECSLGAGYENADVRLGEPFKHLHQLQNLFYSLTGEELQITL